MSGRPWRGVAPAALLAIVLAACSSSARSTTSTTRAGASSSPSPASGSSSSASPRRTTTRADALAYSTPGPYPVGVTTRTLPAGNLVEIWYPARGGTTGTVTYDVRDFVPPAIKALLKGNVPATFTIAGARDAAVADGRFPVVLFSHGFAGIRVQSTYLTSHLASWGFVVAAPDHPSRDLTHALLGQLGPAAAAVADLTATLRLVEADATIGAHVDPTHVAAVGHSAGGGTVLEAARATASIKGYVSLASGAVTTRSTTPTTTPTTLAALPAKPSLFVAGADDHVAPLASVTRPAFDRAPAPSELWVIARSGHNVFDDFCTFGGGKGIIGVAEASGLGAFLDAQPQFRRLGEDGCLPPDAPVREAWPIIEHVVTAWLRNLLGVDTAPRGLDAGAARFYPLNVTIVARRG